jgi:hypothetical protein
MKHTLKIRSKYYAQLRQELESHGQTVRLPENSQAFSSHRVEWREGAPIVAHVFADVRLVAPRDSQGANLRQNARLVKRAVRALRQELRPDESLRAIALVVALPNKFGQIDFDKVAEIVLGAKRAPEPYDVLVVYGKPAHQVEPEKKARALGLGESQVVALCDDFRTVVEAVDHLVRQKWSGA